MKKRGILNLVIIIVIISNLFITYNVRGCKDIVVCGNSTAGDYNLLLKVRDPSRPGLQVLCIVPEGYEYDYHHPRSGNKISFTTIHKYIGVATKGDTIPNIIKSGMSLSKTGIAYGDADTNSKRVNPSKFAWDDFDWIRLACEKANDEDEAVEILTKEGVNQLHASGVSENLFVVGPKKGYIIEADAYQYKIKEIDNGIEVMSNYPKELWKTHRLNLFPISSNFNNVVEKKVRVLSSVRLGSIFGIRITEIGDNYISAKPIHYFHAKRTNNLRTVTKIQLDERKTVGYFSVELLDINGNTARIRVTNIYKAWEEEMLKQINSQTDGKISVKDMINLSRLDRKDLRGLRPMCEPAFKYEAVAIYKIPSSNYEILSNGWFSANHACSSIYIPFHICNTDIYEPYKTGDAAQLCLDLYELYEHDDLIPSFNKIENVFFNEMDEMEKISVDYISHKTDVSEFLTIIDMSMQKQAFLTEEIWKVIDDKESIINIVENIWEDNYLTTLKNIKQALFELDEMSQTNLIKQKLIDISFDICNSRIKAAKALEKEVDDLFDQLNFANNLVINGQYEKGFQKLEKSYTDTNMLINGQVIVEDIVTEINDGEGTNTFLFLLIFVLIIVLIALFTRFKIKFQ